ncbi:miz zinc finger protein [Apiospora arundinis]
MAPAGGQQPSAPRRASGSAPDHLQIAASNSTVETFLGGRKPSWMNNAAASQPTPRPAHYQAPKSFAQPGQATRPVAKQAPQAARDKQTPSSLSSNQPPSSQVLTSLPPSAPARSSALVSTVSAVLPSPAPSDEPSPAVSTTPHETSSPPNNTTANPLPITTEARFEVVPASAEVIHAARPQNHNTLPNGSIPAPSGEVRPMSTSTTSPAAPAALAGTSLQTPPTPSMPTFNHATAPSVPGQDQEHPHKRRRMVSGSTLLQALQAVPVLEAQIQQSGGFDALEANVEKPRYQLLKEACADGDIFFVVLHQIFCLWSSNPRETHKLYIQGIHDPALIDSAFGQMSTILKSNSLIRSEQLDWLVRFPGPVDVLRNAFPEYGGVVVAVLNFLVRLTQFWMVVNNDHRKLGYPILVDEMLSTFQLYSTVLQTIVFRASRRTCGVTDGPVGSEMDKLFKKDQAHHWRNGSFVIRASRDFHKEPINQIIIQKFQALAATQQNPNNAAYMPYNMSPDLRQQAIQQQQQQQQRVNNSSPLQAGPQTSHGLSGPTSAAPSPASAGPSPLIPAAQLGSPATQGSAPSPPEQQVQSPLAPVPTQFQLWSNTPSIQSIPGNGQPPPANHSPRTAQGHFNQPQQMQAFQQQPMSTPQYHHQNSGLRHPSQSHAQASNTRSPQVQNATFIPSQARNNYSSPVNGQATPVQNHQHQSGGHTSPSMQGFMQAPVISPRMNNMPMSVPMGAAAGNVQRAPAPLGSSGRARHPNTRGTLQPQGDQSRVNARNQMPREIRFPPIPLIDHPHDPYDRKSVANALHQADIRSPKRVFSGAFKAASNERYYQFVKYLALRPSPIPPHHYLHIFKFSLSDEEYARISRDTLGPDGAPPPLPINVFSDGSLRLRLRCVCRNVASISEEQWVREDSTWPDQIFIHLNGRVLTVRRKQHYAQDQPIEIGHCVIAGVNELKISVPPNIPNERVWPSAKKPFVAVEVVENLSHSSVLGLHNLSVVSKIPTEQTLGVIKKRLGGPSGGANDDEIAIIASDLTIRVADPFSACIFNTPVRGASCEHLECFDLQTWLNTRPSKKSCVCGSRDSNCRVCPREPSLVDKWKCPICGEDARPHVLRIDGFLSDVRDTLAAQEKLGTKDIAVSADGSWKPVVDTDDEGDDDSDVDVIPTIARSVRSRSASKPMLQRMPVEVISLDDD